MVINFASPRLRSSLPSCKMAPLGSEQFRNHFRSSRKNSAVLRQNSITLGSAMPALVMGAQFEIRMKRLTSCYGGIVRVGFHAKALVKAGFKGCGKTRQWHASRRGGYLRRNVFPQPIQPRPCAFGRGKLQRRPASSRSDARITQLVQAVLGTTSELQNYGHAYLTGADPVSAGFASSLSSTGLERWSLRISLAPFSGSTGVTLIPVAMAPAVHLK